MKHTELINSLLLFLGFITVLTALPLRADRETPTLDEGVAASKLFAKRDRRKIVVATNERLAIVDLSKGNKKQELQLPTTCHDLAASGNGRHIITGNADGTIYVVNNRIQIRG